MNTSILKIFIYIISLMILFLSLFNASFAQTDSLNYNPSVITTIVADKYSSSISVISLPEANSRVYGKNNLVRIEFYNSVLSKNLSGAAYNWNAKLTGQLYDLVQADIKSNSELKKVTLNLKFKNDITVQKVRTNAFRVVFYFKNSVYSLSERLNRMNFSHDSKTIASNSTIISNRASNKDFFKNNSAKPINKSQMSESQINEKSCDSTSSKSPTLIDDPPSVSPKSIEITDIPPDNLTSDPPVANEITNSTVDLTDTNHKKSLEDEPVINNESDKSSEYKDIISIVIALNTQGNDSEAIEKLNQAILLKPEEYEAYNILGDIYLKQNNPTKAIENYEKSLGIKPDQKEISLSLASSYVKVIDYVNALKIYKDILITDSLNYTANSSIAYIYTVQNDVDSSIAYYLLALKAVPANIDSGELAKIYYNLGNAYKIKKEYSKSIDEYRLAIKSDPQFIDSYYNLGAVYLDINYNKKAIEQFKLYIKYCREESEIQSVKELINKLSR